MMISNNCAKIWFTRMAVLLGLLALGTPLRIWAQTHKLEGDVYQLSGLVLMRGSEAPVQYAAVQVLGCRRATLTSFEGFYSLPVLVGDTVEFSCLGFRSSRLIVKDFLAEVDPREVNQESPYLYHIELLAEDSITLPEVTIYPYRNNAEFVAALLAIPVNPNDPANLAKGNLDPRMVQYYLAHYSPTLADAQSLATIQYVQNYETRNQMPTFGPNSSALAEFFRERSKQRKRPYSYWND